MMNKNQLLKNQSLTSLDSFSYYYSGLIHSDGSFFVNILKSASSWSGYTIRLTFSISLGIASLDLIKDIAKFFQCGQVSITATNCTFSVSNFHEIWHIIIPHFLSYPVYGFKFISFQIFVICASLLYPFYYNEKPVWLLVKIIILAFFMNEGSSRTLLRFYHILVNLQVKARAAGNVSGLENIQIYDQPELLANNTVYPVKVSGVGNFNVFSFLPASLNISALDFSLIAHPIFLPLTFILGLIEGDGSFYIGFKSAPAVIYTFGFSITTNISDFPILILIQQRLGCGLIYVKSAKWCRFEVNKIDDLNNKIIPLIDLLELHRGQGINLLCSKKNNYAVWKDGIKKHINKDFAVKKAKSTNEKEIKKTALRNFIINSYNVFDEGKKRKYTLDAFLKLHNLNK